MRKLVLSLLLLMAAVPLSADEGMWLFNRPPLQQLQQRYGFQPTQAWLDHLQKSSVRFNSGGSGSFVSANGLIVTNHHVGLDCLQKISTPEHDYIKDGFEAKTRAAEVKCVDLELNVLMGIEDVTARVNAAVTPGMAVSEAERARRAVMNTIEQESLSASGLRSDVVTLFQGGEYHLYRFKKYTDVRLVFAPEVGIAFFGGDPDNFEYPRYNLDVAFFRAYENGQPVKPSDSLKFSTTGPAEGDLVFVSGHPGSTERLKTVAELQFVRDLRLPFTLMNLRRREVLLRTYAERSAENARRALDAIHSVQNSRKALLGQLGGLQDPSVMEAKMRAEQALRERVNADPQMKAQYAEAWDQIARLIERQRGDYAERYFLSSGNAFGGDLFAKARTIVRYVNEVPKPNADRLREYRESNLESLRQGLLSAAPIHKDLEIILLADTLANWMENTPNDPLIKQVLAGKSPRARAAELVNGTTLDQISAREALLKGGASTVNSSTDPMIQLALLVDPRARELRRTFEEEVQEPLRQEYAKVANATFRASNGNIYPDATFTLRLSFGEVKGYSGNGGPAFPAFTTIAGLYQRATEHQNVAPFDLPKSWIANKSKVSMSTPFNFVATADIIGGNSGSPVVNRNNEFVGIVFDMNLPSLVYNFAWKEEDTRTVAVHSKGILESLRNVYGATGLVSELLGPNTNSAMPASQTSSSSITDTAETSDAARTRLVKQ